MCKKALVFMLCVLMLTALLPAAAFAEIDYDVVTIQKGDTVKNLLEKNGRDYKTDKYVIMVLNGMDRESQMEILTIGDTLKVPKAEKDIPGIAPNLISSKDVIEYYVIPYKIQQNDSLKKIYKSWGLSYYDYQETIKALNPDKDLDLLYVGDLYELPTTEKNLRTNIYTTVMSHIMQDNETVESVYGRYGVNYSEYKAKLQNYNTIDFDQMKTGDKLLIPLVW